MELDEELVEETKSFRPSQGAAERQRLAVLILARSDVEIASLLIKRTEGPNPWQAALDYVRALFYALGSLAKEDETSRSAKVLVSTVVNVIRVAYTSSSTVDRKLTDCVNFLVQEMEWFPRALLPAVSEAVLARLESGGGHQDGANNLAEGGSVHHLLEFLPRCLAVISSAEFVAVIAANGEEMNISGAQYRESVLKRLLAIYWSNKFVTKMATLLREFSLETREMEHFVRKLFVHMKDAEPQDFPSLVYQLLLLACKGFKRIVLAGMIDFFNKKHGREATQQGRTTSKNASKFKSSIDAFHQIEGTIVLHINFAVKQDPTLGQELLYLVRSNSWQLTPFLVSVLLSIGRIHRFEQPAFDLLRATAAKCFRDCQRCRDSRWAAAVLGASSLQAAEIVEDSFMRTVQSSSFGWDHIIPNVVRMGFTLIESATRGRPKSVDSAAPLERVSGMQELGIKVLSAAFEVHEMARDEIIEQSKCRIIGLKPQQSAPILRLIVHLVQNCPRLLLEHVVRFKECLDYFTFLHFNSASALLQAISPLFQLSRDLQDYTVLVLRKAMSGREERARVSAVQGLLDLIVSGKRSSSLTDSESGGRFSETSCSQSSSQIDKHSGGAPGKLLQDLIGLLRRCLSQQASVRATLYKGLPKILEVDPSTADAIFDLLEPHFNRYIVLEADHTATLKLDSCVVANDQGVRVVEPLDHFLSSVHFLLHRSQAGTGFLSHSSRSFGLSESQNLRHQETGSLSSGESLAVAFQKLRKTLSKSSLADLFGGRTLDLCSDTLEGEKMIELARLLLGVMEVLLDSLVLDLIAQNFEKSREDGEAELHTLLNMHDSLMTHMRSQKHGRGIGKSSERKDQAKKSQKRPPKHRNGAGKSVTPKDQGSQPVGKAGLGSNSRTVLDIRKSFLSSSCIIYLMNSYATSLHSNRTQREREPSNDDREAPSGQLSPAGERGASSDKETRLARFGLQNCLQFLNGVGSDAVIGQADDFEMTNKDCQLLARPLSQIVLALRDSHIESGLGHQEAAPKGRGRPAKVKTVNKEGGDGLMIMSLKCLEELIKVASKRGFLVEAIKDMDMALSDQHGEDGHESDGEVRRFEKSDGSLFQWSDAKVIHLWLTNSCRPLLEKLLSSSHYSEVEVLCGIVQNLGSRLPQALMKKNGSWARRRCKEETLRNLDAARSWTSMAIALSPHPDDIIFSKVLGSELQKVMGSDEDEPMERSDEYPMVNKSTATVVCTLVLHNIENALVDVEWLASKLKIQSSMEVFHFNRRIPLCPGGSQRTIIEEQLHLRMEGIMSVLSSFTSMTISGAMAEQVLRATMHFYRCLSGATRLLLAPKGFTQPLPSPLFQKLAELTCKQLTASVYTFMTFRPGGGPVTGETSASQIKREGRIIPNLIFHIEESERYLLQLSKVSKVNLLRYAKRSTARDFRITDSGKKRKSAAMQNAEPPEESDEEERAARGSSDTENEGEEESVLMRRNLSAVDVRE